MLYSFDRLAVVAKDMPVSDDPEMIVVEAVDMLDDGGLVEARGRIPHDIELSASEPQQPRGRPCINLPLEFSDRVEGDIPVGFMMHP
ncbi:MAG TPA: hypothetical protein VD840_13545, partial [Sinorhizobium sp.]|nr:hypothetical protein [Sinorhizobium sp.]